MGRPSMIFRPDSVDARGVFKVIRRSLVDIDRTLRRFCCFRRPQHPSLTAFAVSTASLVAFAVSVEWFQGLDLLLQPTRPSKAMVSEKNPLHIPSMPLARFASSETED